MTQVHYLFTDDCGGVAHCHTHIHVLIFFRSDSANGHILGYGDPGVGPMTPKLELGQDFCTMHLTAKFHHPTFNHSEVVVLTNKQTPLKTSTSLRYATPVGNKRSTEKLLYYRFRATYPRFNLMPDWKIVTWL